jgi:hypothetical protein
VSVGTLVTVTVPVVVAMVTATVVTTTATTGHGTHTVYQAGYVLWGVFVTSVTPPSCAGARVTTPSDSPSACGQTRPSIVARQPIVQPTVTVSHDRGAGGDGRGNGHGGGSDGHGGGSDDGDDGGDPPQPSWYSTVLLVSGVLTLCACVSCAS